MIPIQALLHRIQWDSEFAKGEFVLGCYSDLPRSQSYPPLLRWFYPDRGNFIAFVSNLGSRRALREVVAAFRVHSDYTAESLGSPAFVPGVAWSDQLSFWRQDYPAAHAPIGARQRP